jgi:hypothetical protein
MGPSTRGLRLLRAAVALGIAAVSCPAGAGLAASVPVSAGWRAVDRAGRR